MSLYTDGNHPTSSQSSKFLIEGLPRDCTTTRVSLAKGNRVWYSYMRHCVVILTPPAGMPRLLHVYTLETGNKY